MKDLEKALSARCVLIKGGDGILVADALTEIVKRHKASGDEVSPEMVTADSHTPPEWIGAASSGSFFSDIQVFVVRNLGRLNPNDVWEAKAGKGHPFVKMVSELPDFARLILVGDEEIGSSQKASNSKDSVERWAKILDHTEAIILNVSVEGKDAIGFIENLAKSMGISMSKGACQKLSIMVGGQAGLAKAELEKTAMFVSPRKDIREADLDKVVMPEPEYNIFQLTEAIVKGEAGTALKELAIVVSSSSPTNLPGEALSRILPMVHRQLRLVWQARVCIEERCTPSTPPDRVIQKFPEKPQLHKEKDWTQQKSMGLARTLSLDQLSACFGELARADGKLKGILPSFSAKEVLEEMTLRMVANCQRQK